MFGGVEPPDERSDLIGEVEPLDELPDKSGEVEPPREGIPDLEEPRLGVADQEREAFLKDSGCAFIELGVRAAAHAAGVGLIYEAYSISKKVVDAAEAVTSDDGAEVSVPVPVGCVDLMFKVHLYKGASDESHPPLTMYVAPGEDSWAAAFEVGPEHERDEHPRVSAKGRSAETASEKQGVTDPRYATIDERVNVRGRIALTTLDLGALRNHPRKNQLLILRDFSEQKLRPFLAEAAETRDLDWLVGIDPELRLAFGTRVTSDPSGGWRTVAEVDLVNQRLAIRELEQGASLESSARELVQEDDEEGRRARISRAYGEQLALLITEFSTSVFSLKKSGSGYKGERIEKLQQQHAHAQRIQAAHDQMLSSPRAARLREEFHRKYDESLLHMGEAIEELRLDSRLERAHEERIRQARAGRGLTSKATDLAGNVPGEVIHHISCAVVNHGLLATQDEAEFALIIKRALETVESVNGDSVMKLNTGFITFDNGSIRVLLGTASPNDTRDQSIPGSGPELTLGSRPKSSDAEVTIVVGPGAGSKRRHQPSSTAGNDSAEASGAIIGEAHAGESRQPPILDGRPETVGADGVDRVVGGVIVGWPVSAQSGVVTTDELIQHALGLIFDKIHDGSPESAAWGMKAVRGLQVIVIFDPGMQEALWIDVDPVTQCAAAVFILQLSISDDETRSARFLHYAA